MIQALALFSKVAGTSLLFSAWLWLGFFGLNVIYEIWKDKF